MNKAKHNEQSQKTQFKYFDTKCVIQKLSKIMLNKRHIC
jgi:hypothetical protein